MTKRGTNLEQFKIKKQLAVIVFAIMLLVPSLAFAQSESYTVAGNIVNYEIIGGSVSSISIESDLVELVINIVSTEDGNLQITMPRNLLDSRINNSDDVFYVLVDGFEAFYVEIESTSQNRTILIPFVTGNEQIEILGTDALTDTSQTDTQIEIPDWIKNNAKWWADNQIGDSDFILGIQYLINQGIMKIPGTTSGSSSSQEIPDWIKSNAGWWADGLITDDDFVSGMQYLIINGIIVV